MVARARTAYRMTRSSHLIAPSEGHDAGGRGSMNSGGSRGSSENSLTRSTATCPRLGSERAPTQKRVLSHHGLLQADEAANLERRAQSLDSADASPAYKAYQEEKLEGGEGQSRLPIGSRQGLTS